MNVLLQGKPPWKNVEWVRSPSWTSVSVPKLEFTSWDANSNEQILQIKDKIENLDKEHKWELAKKMVNPYELVYTHDDERLPPSLSLEQPLSRSYFKLIEILHVFSFFDEIIKDTLRFSTAHIAEGPGGFMQAIYNRAEYKKKTITSSVAMTLRSTTSNIPGWKKATNFLHKYKQIKIHYGEDGTGDVYKSENQTTFIKTCKAGVNLFTADGGFDFSIDYSSQEQNVFHLLICSTLTGLQTLRNGGAFVLKLFDCMSPHTKLLIIILGRHFKEWTLYKPAMTRPCNSERYFLGKGFRGILPDMIRLIKEIESNSLRGLYPILRELSSEQDTIFISNHINISIKSQIESIEQAIYLSQNPQEWWEKWVHICIHFSNLWCETFSIPATPARAYQLLTATRFPHLFSQTSHTGAFLQ